MVNPPSARPARETRITSAVCRDDIILRLDGDVYVTSMTWMGDDRQLLSFIDGAGWPATPRNHYYSSRLFTVSGDPHTAVFQDVSGYPDIPLSDIYKGKVPLYYGFTVLAVDGHLYQYLTTSTKQPFSGDLRVNPDFRLNAVKLVYSVDNGRTWRNQDGSTPVVRETQQNQTHRTMVFLQEAQGAFSMLSFLQMGRDYRDNRDGYVYVYAPNGTTDGTMNELVMFRVRKERLLDREAYQFFVGNSANGNAHWDTDLSARGVMHTFPRGWVHWDYSFSWLPSVVYNAPLGVYIMANASSPNPAGIKSEDGASYFGLWIADYPWGPWRQIHEQIAWTPSGDSAARAGAPVIPPKWIAKDGKSFWLVWNEGQPKNESEDRRTEEALIKAMRSACEAQALQGRWRWRQYHPGWSFNTQRVDLVVR